MGESSARSVHGAIAERPRSIRQHPLLDAIYERHDQLIADHTRGTTLEVAFGRHAHPYADVAVDIARENTHQAVGVEAVTGDIRALPFRDGEFKTVIGRRFIHHLPAEERIAMLTELRRVLSHDGRLILLEGTPGLFRRLVKGIAFKLGVLGEDTDEHGHLTAAELERILHFSGFDIETSLPLGSPLMPLSIVEDAWATKFMGLYQRTQWIRWWTFAVCVPTANQPVTSDAPVKRVQTTR